MRLVSSMLPLIVVSIFIGSCLFPLVVRGQDIHSQDLKPVSGSQAGKMCVPDTPSNPDPFDGETLSSEPTVLDWSNASGADSYDVWVDGSFMENVTSSRWYPTFSFAPGNHTWRIVAINSCGYTAGPVWSFNFNPCSLPGTPGNPDPFDGQTISSQPGVLDWSSANRTDSYDVRLFEYVPGSAWTRREIEDVTYFRDVLMGRYDGQTVDPNRLASGDRAFDKFTQMSNDIYWREGHWVDDGLKILVYVVQGVVCVVGGAETAGFAW